MRKRSKMILIGSLVCLLAIIIVFAGISKYYEKIDMSEVERIVIYNSDRSKEYEVNIDLFDTFVSNSVREDYFTVKGTKYYGDIINKDGTVSNVGLSLMYPVYMVSSDDNIKYYLVNDEFSEEWFRFIEQIFIEE